MGLRPSMGMLCCLGCPLLDVWGGLCVAHRWGLGIGRWALGFVVVGFVVVAFVVVGFGVIVVELVGGVGWPMQS
jgi:hypothetical protein